MSRRGRERVKGGEKRGGEGRRIGEIEQRGKVYTKGGEITGRVGQRDAEEEQICARNAV